MAHNLFSRTHRNPRAHKREHQLSEELDVDGLHFGRGSLPGESLAGKPCQWFESDMHVMDVKSCMEPIVVASVVASVFLRERERQKPTRKRLQSLDL